jgi:ubiquinone/menaquinone biosynthesis C-methylase UbiE
MDHRDHVQLLRGAVDRPGRWLELGAGDGEFTLALADLLGPGGTAVALDRDAQALGRLERRVRAGYADVALEIAVADFTSGLPSGPFDGVLAANSLHFVRDPRKVLDAVRTRLAPGGRLVLVEYDTDQGNPWVPFPISFAAWQRLAPAAGYAPPRLLGRVPSRFLGAIYSAVAESALAEPFNPSAAG